MEVQQKDQQAIVFDTSLMPYISTELRGLLSLAAHICHAKVAVIAMMVNNKNAIIEQYGSEHINYQLPSFLNEQQFIVSDTQKDIRFDSILVNDRRVRFFANLPIVFPGYLLTGQLCVMNDLPYEIQEHQFDSLQMIARQLSFLLKKRNEISSIENKIEKSVKIEDALSNIFHNFNDAIIIINQSGTIEDSNPKASQLFGWSKQEMIGQVFHSLLLPESFHGQHQQILKKFGESSQHDFPNTYQEISAIDKFKNELHISLAISSVCLKNNQLYICSINDISDRNLITDKLDKQKEFYEKILNTLPTDIAVFDPDHKYLFVNPGAISIEEYRKFIIGKDDYQYAAFRNRPKSSADGRRAKFLEVKNHGKEIRWEDTLPDPNGYMITHLRRMYPVHDENGKLTMVIGFGIDITDRKLMEEKQSLLVDQLSAQNVQLIDFCNIVSHNLRAPLVNLSMLVDLIERNEDEEKRSVFISKLKPVLAVLHATFTELVESIQIKQDLEIQSEWINLDTCMSRTLKILDLEINLSEATIECDFDDAPAIYFPPKYIYSIFQNFLSNSLKYQSPERKLSVKFQSKKLPDDKILLSITDNGLGIDLEKNKDNIFKIGKVFHHHRDARGFGLFMTKSQVDAMNSKIWVESELNKGSTFYIEFSNQHHDA